MGEKLDITAFPAETKLSLDATPSDLKKDTEKPQDVEASDESSVTGGEVYDAERWSPITTSDWY